MPLTDWAAARAAWVIGVAASVFGMSACLSANSLVYLCVGLSMVLGIWAYVTQSWPQV